MPEREWSLEDAHWWEYFIELRYLAFHHAKARLRATLGCLPLIEAPWRHGNRFYRSVSFSVAESHGLPPLPFGWSAEKCFDRAALDIGPSWYMLPRRWYRTTRAAFYRKAVEIGAAVAPYDGCYYHELEWWPSRPRAN